MRLSDFLKETTKWMSLAPTITVVMPLYHSVLISGGNSHKHNQPNFWDFEFIVINGWSADKPAAILEK